jgi:hypothetical protein
LIKQLRSGFLTTQIFSFAFNYDEAVGTLRLLSRAGYNFAAANQVQLAAFCYMPPRYKVDYLYGVPCIQRPSMQREVHYFSFWGISDNLYESHDYIRESKGFLEVWLGNKDFKMENVDPEKTQLNTETLTLLIKKTKSLTLNRINKTHTVLKYICDNAESFQNLTSLTLES